MRGPLRARLRGVAGLAASCVLGAVAILAVNMAVVGAAMYAEGLAGGGTAPEASKVSESIVERDGAYAVPPDMEQALRDNDSWALLIDEGGNVVWGLGVPDDVPTRYTPADVASFARWYLNDYPVSCWRRDGKLVVVGSPRGSAWKYSFSQGFDEFSGGVLLLIALFCVNLVSLVVFVSALSRRSWKRRDDARNEWVAAVSHDVRTPLSAVVADAARLMEDPGLDAGARERAARIVAKSREAAGLLADLNAVNRLRYAMEPIDAGDVRLAAVLRSVVAGFLDEGTGACELELDVAPAAEGVCVRGSESLLRRMAVNLVGNSFRHNLQGCRVTVSLDVRGGLLGTPFGRRLVLVVSDDGRGLGADALAALGRRPGSDLPEHGLGLVIVRRIAAAHGGDARFSNNAGGGCRCAVTLPAGGRHMKRNLKASPSR
jgi:signal transduction histidine kinase